MARHSISNGIIRIQVEEKGAELQELFYESTQTAFLWKGDPAFWGKFSPVLFPVVGALKNNTYIYGNKTYSLGRHGFARDRMFELIKKTPDQLVFMLKADAESLKVYPFDFSLYIYYTINGSQLSVSYEVSNNSGEELYFSIGAHPAFAVPYAPGTSYEDYYLDFGKPVTAEKWPINAEGLIKAESVPALENSSTLPLTKALFEKDALVFKNFPVSSVRIRSDKTPLFLQMDWDDDFPFLGIWAAPGADFVCIEPWCGIADSETSSGALIAKEGIRKLAPGDSQISTWTVSLPETQ